MPNDIQTIAQLELTRQEADLVVAGLNMLLNNRRYAQFAYDDAGEVQKANAPLAEFARRVKSFSQSAFTPS